LEKKGGEYIEEVAAPIVHFKNYLFWPPEGTSKRDTNIKYPKLHWGIIS